MVQPSSWVFRSILITDFGLIRSPIPVVLTTHPGKPDEEADDDPWGNDETETIMTGLIRENTADKVVLFVGYERYQTIESARIDHIEIKKDSRMPDNYSDLMTFRQIADIVAYLESLHAPSPEPGKTSE